MTLKKTMKLIALVAVFAMILSFAACKPTGALELKSFTVDRSSVKTNYLVGEEIDFSGIKATAKYTDESLNKVYTYNELTITYPEDITATAGDKDVIVSFMDPNLNVKQETKVTIKVTTEPVVEEEMSVMVMFEEPDALKQFKAFNNVNTSLKPDESGFSGQFAVGGKTYVIGNENDFCFNPEVTVMDENGDVKALESFFSVVEIFVEKNGEYVALTATAGEGTFVSYYDGETLIATVDTYNGRYDFSDAAAGLKVKISVLPSEEHYIRDGEKIPVVLEAKIVKAYNIYEAWELAVIDNDNTDNREGNGKLDDGHIWDTFKNEKGIANVTVSGVVLHTDLHLTADDIPEAFFFTTDKEIEYFNAVSGETKTIPAGTKYLYDWSSIYRRVLNPGETFIIEGNFFSINLAGFPLVASPNVSSEYNYESDFSNCDLFRFVNHTEATEENFANVSLQNLSLKGNAARDNWVDAEKDGNLVSAGGLIFLKSNHYVTVNFDNILGNSFFITYFADDRSVMNVDNVKCYDSYQNAIYMWGNAKMNIADSFFVGAGGPMAIISSPRLNNVRTYPQLNATNTTFESHVTGEEVWFNAIGGGAVVTQMKALSAGLKDGGMGSFVDDNGNMNIQGLIMPEGSNANEVLGGVDAQGYLFIDGKGMDRSMTNAEWLSILQKAQELGAMPPFLTVYDDAGNAYTAYVVGTDLYDLNNKKVGEDPMNQAALMMAFANPANNQIVLTQGGISVILEFYH